MRSKSTKSSTSRKPRRFKLNSNVSAVSRKLNHSSKCGCQAPTSSLLLIRDFNRRCLSWVEYKEFIHERDIKANRFHHDEATDLRNRINELAQELEQKDNYYSTIEKTVETINETVPLLMKEKLELKGELKQEEQKNMFMRHEMM